MLVGGTSKLKGFIDFLEDRLINKLSELDNEIERVEIFNYPAIDMKTLSWIGGSILPKLESSKDMWIQKERWLGEPEKLEEQIENNENNKKENNNNANNNIIEDTLFSFVFSHSILSYFGTLTFYSYLTPQLILYYFFFFLEFHLILRLNHS